MKRKPKGPKYRSLSVRGGVIYYERVWKGRRFCVSTKTDDWNEAAAVRDLYEERKGIGGSVRILIGVPTFEEFAERYLKEDTDDLARTTLSDRRRELRSDGRVIGYFGHMRLDEITSPLVREFWNRHVIGEGRGPGAGKNDIKALSAVLRYAAELNLLETNPARTFRQTLSRKRRSQQGRWQSDPERHTRPIEDPADMRKLVTAAQGENPSAHLLTLLLLDAGLGH